MHLSALVLVGWLVAACAAPAARPAAAPAPAATQVAAASAPTHSPEVERLLAAARAAGETQLDVSWAEDTLGGHEGARQLGELFNRLYGTDVRINFTPGRLDQVTLRLTQEANLDRRPFVDLFLGSETHIRPLYLQNVLEPYDYTALSPRITPELLAPEGVAVQVASRVGGLSYNTNLVSAAEAPTRLEDVLNPKWKGVVASTPTAIGFDSVAFRPEWTPDRMRGFVRRLSDQAGGLIRGGEQERIATGEFVMLVLNTGSQEVHKLRARGAPIAHAIPDDASTINFHYLAVPRRSARPNLAKLFVNAMVAEEAQRLIYAIAYYDLHKLVGSRTAAELAEVRARGATPLEVDVQFTLGHPEIDALRDDLFKIVSERQGG